MEPLICMNALSKDIHENFYKKGFFERFIWQVFD